MFFPPCTVRGREGAEDLRRVEPRVCQDEPAVVSCSLPFPVSGALGRHSRVLEDPAGAETDGTE